MIKTFTNIARTSFDRIIISFFFADFRLILLKSGPVPGKMYLLLKFMLLENKNLLNLHDDYHARRWQWVKKYTAQFILYIINNISYIVHLVAVYVPLNKIYYGTSPGLGSYLPVNQIYNETSQPLDHQLCQSHWVCRMPIIFIFATAI